MQKPKIPSILELVSAENFGRITSALKFSVIAVVVVAVYCQDLSIVFNGALHDEATFHILAIPLLFAYLLYRKKR
jgi:hypothetical protein